MKTTAIFAWLFLPVPALGQVPDRVSLQDAIRLALQNNPTVHAARLEAEAARSAVASARALRNPEVTFTPSLTKNATTDEFTFQQLFEVNGTRSARSAAAVARLGAARSAAEWQARSLAFDVASAYLGVSRQRERLQVERDVLAINQEVERIAARQAEVGSKPGIERVQAEIETIRQRRVVRDLEGQLEAQSAELTRLVGKEIATEQLASDFPLFAVAAKGPRADVQQQMLLTQAAAAEVRQERSEGRPDLGAAATAPSLIREPRSFGIGLMISLPIFDYGARRNRIRELQRIEEAQRLRAQGAQVQAETEIKQARARASAAESALRTVTDGLLERAERLLRASRVGYEAGQTTLLGLLEAQRTFRAAQTENVEARYDYALALAEVARASGSIGGELVDEWLVQGGGR